MSPLRLAAFLWAALLPAFAGCSSLPRLDAGGAPTEVALSTPAAVQLEGRRGPLSPAQSQAMLTRLGRNGPETSIFERHLALEEAVTDSPLTTGNQVLLLQDGPATYAAMLAAIEGARDHIHMETYILDDDAEGRRFMQALLARQQQGVQVNLIRDSVGTVATPAALFEPLRASGGQVLEFNPVNPLAGPGGLVTQPTRSPQVAHRGWAHGLPGGHQHQQRLLGRVLAQARRRRPGLARHRPSAEGPGGG